jgi:hypothetical protein
MRCYGHSPFCSADGCQKRLATQKAVELQKAVEFQKCEAHGTAAQTKGTKRRRS